MSAVPITSVRRDSRVTGRGWARRAKPAGSALGGASPLAGAAISFVRRFG